MTIQPLEFVDKYLGQSKGYPNDDLYKGECLSIVKLYIKECFGIEPPPSGTNSAYGYWVNFPNPLGTVFEKIENTDTLIPQQGWIAIWKPWATNIYGHISIVADGCTTGTLKNWAQNWTSKVFQLESNRYTNVKGFLKPKESIIEDMTEEQKRILQFLEEQKANESRVREAFGALADIPKLRKEVDDLKAYQVDLAQRLSDLELKLAQSEKSEANLKTEIISKNTTIKLLRERKAIEDYNKYELIGIAISRLIGKKVL